MERAMVVDWDKVNTVEDLKVVMEGINFRFHSVDGNFSAHKEVMPYLKEAKDATIND